MHRLNSFIDPLRCLLNGYPATLGVNPRPPEGRPPGGEPTLPTTHPPKDHDMDPARGAGDTPGYVEDTGTPVVPSRTPTGASERGEGATGQAPETANTATARAAADI